MADTATVLKVVRQLLPHTNKASIEQASGTAEVKKATIQQWQKQKE
ncbi:hypothetical protein AINA4_07150 [Aurantimicrobium sp. INA4]|nr:hypothetical protein AINA4_07150 [Aurantimicrobium sp. INA4]